MRSACAFPNILHTKEAVWSFWLKVLHVCSLRTRPLRETRAVDQPTYCPHVDHSMFHSPASVDPLREATLLPRVEVIFGDLRAHQQGEERSGESENGIRPRNISSRKRLLPGFKPSIGLLDP